VPHKVASQSWRLSKARGSDVALFFARIHISAMFHYFSGDVFINLPFAGSLFVPSLDLVSAAFYICACNYTAEHTGGVITSFFSLRLFPIAPSFFVPAPPLISNVGRCSRRLPITSITIQLMIMINGRFSYRSNKHTACHTAKTKHD